MQQFSIKDVEHLLGIKAHTLRVWEQRYDFFAPKRKTSLHRTYDNDDLKRLLRVSFLYHQGWKISHIAALSPEAFEEEIGKVPLNGNTYPHFVVQLLEYGLSFNEQAFDQLLERISGLIGFERTVEEVCFPFLQRVGLLWMTNHMVPAQEHFASYLIQSKIIAATDAIALPERPTEMVLFAPKGEFHELPLLYLHYLLRKNGWSVVFLGKNVNLAVVKECAAVPGIQYLFLHLLTNLTQLDPEDYLEELVRQFPGKMIIASGAGVHRVKRTFVNVQLLHTDKEIHAFIKRKMDIPKYIIKVGGK